MIVFSRDYKLGEAEKGLTEKRYRTVSDRLRELWGADAGWVQAVLFYNELQQKSPEKRKRKSETADCKIERKK